MYNEKIKLFLSGSLQVFFVVANTAFVAKELYLFVILFSYLISLIWTFNVTKVAFGTNKDRHIYAAGASFGGLLGLLTSSYFIDLANYFHTVLNF